MSATRAESEAWNRVSTTNTDAVNTDAVNHDFFYCRILPSCRLIVQIGVVFDLTSRAFSPFFHSKCAHA